MKHGALLAASLLFAFALAAQESDEPSRGPDGGSRIRVTGIEVLPVTGRPFPGRSTTEWTRNLGDGNIAVSYTHLSRRAGDQSRRDEEFRARKNLRDDQRYPRRAYVCLLYTSFDQQGARVLDADLNLCELRDNNVGFTERYRGIRRGQPNHLHASCVSRADSGRCVFDY